MQKKPKKPQQVLKVRLKPEYKKKFFKISDQVLALMMLEPTAMDTEMIVFYIKSKFK